MATEVVRMGNDSSLDTSLKPPALRFRNIAEKGVGRNIRTQRRERSYEALPSRRGQFSHDFTADTVRLQKTEPVNSYSVRMGRDSQGPTPSR